MATNPMQRKARNSFLLGMFITLIITGAIIGFLFIQLKQKYDEEKAEAQSSVSVYVLKQNVSSGQVITQDMLDQKVLPKSLVPSNATSNSEFIYDFSLQDKEGNDIYTKVENNQVKLYIELNNKEYEVQKEEETDNYYIKRSNNNDDKEYLELNNVPVVAKVTMNSGTVITPELISKSDNIVQNDVRRQEYNTVVLPMDLATGDYIDIRLMLPSGQDYIVVSKKEVEVPFVGSADSADTIWVNLAEEEILHMSCAIIDNYQIPGSKLYATKYTEAGMQTAATVTYPASQQTVALLQSDPNILEKAMNGIRSRYNQTNGTSLRNDYINALVGAEEEETRKSNIQSNMEESITNANTSRKEYIESLSTPSTD